MKTFIILIHWRIKPECIEDFKKHWRENNKILDRTYLIHEFLSEALPVSTHKYTTWHLDESSLGDHQSYVTVGIWANEAAFKKEIARYFNDRKPMLPFEKYRRRRVAFDPVEWRIGGAKGPVDSSSGVM